MFQPYIAVVKKTFRYSDVFFYNHLYHPSVFRNLFLKSGITPDPCAIDIAGFQAYGPNAL